MIDLVNMLRAICQRNRDALEYIPEYWLVAELYADLKKQASCTGWMPLVGEIPYVTLLPTETPKMNMRDGTTRGGVKVADLCLWNDADEIWGWLEFKASVFRGQKTYKNYYFKAICHDLAALIGFTIEDTADAWEHRDKSIENHIEKYKFEYFQLQSRSYQLRKGTQHFAAAYVQVGIELDWTLWDKARLLGQVQSWKSNIRTQYGQNLLKALPDIDLFQEPIGKGIWVVLAQWSLQK